MFLDSACALDCMRLFRFRRFGPHMEIPPFFHVFGPSDMKLLKSLSSKIRKASKRFRVKSRPPSRQRWDWKCSWTRLVIRPIIWVKQGASLPNGIPKLTVSPTKNRWSRFFRFSLSLSPKGVWSCLILSTFLAETFLLGFHHIISYPKNTNSEVKRKDSNEWYILFTVPIRSCCLLWSLLPWFCLKKSSSHLYLQYIFEKPWHFKRRTVETLHINSCRISPSWPTHGAGNAPRFKLQSKNP